MTTLRKIIAFTALVAAFAVAVHLARIAFRQHAEIPELQAQVELARQQVAQLRREHANATRQWDTLQAPLARAQAQAASDAVMESAIRTRLARVKQLKALIAQHPTLDLPELQLLDDDAWLEVADQNRSFEGNDEIRSAMPADEARSAVFDLRLKARMELAGRMQNALGLYQKNSHGVLPADITDLAPFFESPLDPAILPRYQMLHTGRLDDLPHEALSALGASEPGTSLFGAHPSANGRDDSISREAETAAVIGEKDDGVFAGESRLRLGRDSFAIQGDFEIAFPGLGDAVNRAAMAFMARAGPGQGPVTLDKVLPYFDPPLDTETQRRLQQFTAEQTRRKEQNPFPDLKP